jgi:ribose/xylose/arabinose/galactoside ABC-type transport system permease subunit
MTPIAADRARPAARPAPTAIALTRFLSGREGVLLVTLVLLGLAIDLGSHGALFYPANVTNFLVNFAITAIPATGMTIVILTGGIDVSTGSMLGLIAALGGKLLAAGWGLAVAVPAFLLLGAFFGLVNAVIIIEGAVPPIVATLGTLSIYRMLVFIALGSTWLTDIPPILTKIFVTTRLGPLPMATLLALLVMAGFAAFLRFFRAGRHIYALGNNEEAARLAGLDVRRIKRASYVLIGVFTGLAALLTLGQSPLVQTSTGSGFVLTVIAAVVLGGTELAGGKGTILGTLLGTLIVQLVEDGVVLLHIQPFWSGVLLGFIILASVGLSHAWRRPAGAA